MSGLGLVCDAICTFYSSGAPRVKREALLGSCERHARYYRDGHPVCGVHRNAKSVEWLNRAANSPAPRGLWGAS